jgi:phage-related protein
LVAGDNSAGYNTQVYEVIAHCRPSGRCPYEDFICYVYRDDLKGGARIDALVNQLREKGWRLGVETNLAKKLNDVWELIPKPYRVFFYWDAVEQRYILLSGFRKKGNKTPAVELERAERLMKEHISLREVRHEGGRD